MPSPGKERWDLTPAQARERQDELADRVVIDDRHGEIATVAGVDAGFEDRGRITRAAVSVHAWPGLEPLAQSVARLPTSFPYVPGLLSFRELPAVLDALEQLEELPDLMLCDGQGIAHPRRLGIASHLGVLIDRPTVGVAKSRLTGEFTEPGPRKGERSDLRDGEERIGVVLRSRDGVRPLFVSPGHRVSIESAARWALRSPSLRSRRCWPVRAG